MNIVPNLDRRTVLNGVTLGAGAVVLQPFLNALAAEARGETPPRIVFVVEANGLWDHHVRPQTLGKAGMWNSALEMVVEAQKRLGVMRLLEANNREK